MTRHSKPRSFSDGRSGAGKKQGQLKTLHKQARTPPTATRHSRRERSVPTAAARLAQRRRRPPDTGVCRTHTHMRDYVAHTFTCVPRDAKWPPVATATAAHDPNTEQGAPRAGAA